MIVKFEHIYTEIDWDKQQLLVSKNSDVVVLTNGEHKLGLFEGLSIDTNPEFSKEWNKSNFKKFYGTILND
jgi:hypothetical protein